MTGVETHSPRALNAYKEAYQPKSARRDEKTKKIPYRKKASSAESNQQPNVEPRRRG